MALLAGIAAPKGAGTRRAKSEGRLAAAGTTMAVEVEVEVEVEA